MGDTDGVWWDCTTDTAKGPMDMATNDAVIDAKSWQDCMDLGLTVDGARSTGVITSVVRTAMLISH